MRPRRSLTFLAARTRPRALVTAVVAVLAVTVSLLLPTTAGATTAASADAVASASAADVTTVATGLADAAIVKTSLAGFNPENLISDALFYDGAAMTAAQIQTFLDQKIGACRNGKCLNVANATIQNRAKFVSQTTGQLVCEAVQGGTMRASELIYRMQAACGISAKVILVTLQKEQGLVTSKAPSDWNIRAAMGMGCPDGAPCSTVDAGLGLQIANGVEQIKKYKATRFGKQPGRQFIGYHPTASRNCGGTYLNVANYATAALYNYTPYQPNAAALRAGYGLGDACSSYGNRNFYNYYTDWFGPTQHHMYAATSAPAVSGTVVAGQVIRANTGTWSPTPSSFRYQWLRDGAAVSGASAGTYRVTAADAGKTLSVRTTSERYAYETVTSTSAGVAAGGFSVTRLGGTDRYDTAVEVAKVTHPQGAKTVYLATGADFPDALAASAAAAREGAVLLLAPASALPRRVEILLGRWKPSTVVLVGGEGALDGGTEDRVRAAVGGKVNVERIGGIDRYETAAKVASRAGSTGEVFLATGQDFPDALGAAAIAGSRGAALLLVDGVASDASEASRAAKSLKAKAAFIVGGTGVVGDSIARQIRDGGMNVQRFGGATRYDTNAALIAGTMQGRLSNAVLATGLEFPDALTGSVLAAQGQGPLLATLPTCLSPQAADVLKASAGARVTVVGGPGAVSDSVARFARC